MGIPSATLAPLPRPPPSQCTTTGAAPSRPPRARPTPRSARRTCSTCACTLVSDSRILAKNTLRPSGSQLEPETMAMSRPVANARSQTCTAPRRLHLACQETRKMTRSQACNDEKACSLNVGAMECRLAPSVDVLEHSRVLELERVGARLRMPVPLVLLANFERPAISEGSREQCAHRLATVQRRAADSCKRSRLDDYETRSCRRS